MDKPPSRNSWATCFTQIGISFGLPDYRGALSYRELAGGRSTKTPLGLLWSSAKALATHGARRILLEEGAGVTEALKAIRGPLFGLFLAAVDIGDNDSMLRDYGPEITRRIRAAGRPMQLDVMRGRESAICSSMRVVVFYGRSMGERCTSIRYRLQTRRDGLAEAYATDDAEGAFVVARNKVMNLDRFRSRMIGLARAAAASSLIP